ncbi:hypothetical protein ELP15_29845, partial [Klebsiella pneumoniae]|nr:hypothetical protein [Klebsiella pneumoniae]
PPPPRPPPPSRGPGAVNYADGPDYGEQVNFADGPDYGKKVNFADGPDYGNRSKPRPARTLRIRHISDTTRTSGRAYA